MDMDKLVALCRRRGFLFSVERDLRRAERLLGLRAAGRGAEAEHQGRLVAGHGLRAQRTGPAGRRTEHLRNGRARLFDHHAPTRLEVLGPLRFVPRPDGRLPRDEPPLPLRPGPRPVGRGEGAAGVRGHRGRARDGGDPAAGAEVLQDPGEGRGPDRLGRRRNDARQGGTISRRCLPPRPRSRAR